MSPDLQIVLANALLPVLIVFTGGIAYWFGIRPVLKRNPVFSTMFDAETSVKTRLHAKFSGVKQVITTIIVSAGGFVVVAHDELAPLITQAGVDPSQFLPKVPTWVWPMITMAILWLVQYFRNTADRQARANAEALLNAGHPLAAPAPGLPVTTLPSPGPFPDKVG